MKICSRCKIEKEICEFTIHSNNKDGLNYNCKECESNRKKEYRKFNRDKENNYKRNKLKNDIVFYLSNVVRNRIHRFLKLNNLDKSSKTFEIVGCSPLELKNYIEQQFIEGMSWDKMGKEIHIDHKIPLSSAKSKEEVYMLCHYSNLQPLWAKDNILKGKKTIYYNTKYKLSTCRQKKILS